MNPIMTLGIYQNLPFAGKLHRQHGNIFPCKSRLPQQVRSAQLKKGFYKEVKEHSKESEVFIWSSNSTDSNLMGLHDICVKQSLSTETPQHTGLKRSTDNIPVPDAARNPQMFFVETLTGQSSFESAMRTCSLLSGYTSQQQGSVGSWLSWVFLCGIWMFYLCPHGFPPGTLVSFPQFKNMLFRLTGNDKSSLGFIYINYHVI